MNTSTKRIKLRIVEDQLHVTRLVPLVLVNPHTGIVEDTELPVTPEELNRGYGFGSFLLSITVDEVDYDQAVVDFLGRSINRKYSSMGDLFGFSFHGPNADSRNE